MDHASGRAPIRRPVVFRDGLGRRCRLADAAGAEKFELLIIRNELADVPSFETALRERVRRLASFKHEAFARVQSVERLGGQSPTLVVISERTQGVRLSDVLAVAARQEIPIDGDTAWWLVWQLTGALSALHNEAPNAAHGAIAPERIVVTPEGQVVVVEHVLGSALEQLRYSPERYWQELRVACPHTVGLPRFDARADVTQVGVVTLALLSGRPLDDTDFPAAYAGVEAARVFTGDGRREPVSVGLRTWLARTLQLDLRQSFGSAVEARAELERLVQESGESLAPAGVVALLNRCLPLLERSKRPSGSVPVAEASDHPSGLALAPPAGRTPPAVPSASTANPARGGPLRTVRTVLAAPAASTTTADDKLGHGTPGHGPMHSLPLEAQGAVENAGSADSELGVKIRTAVLAVPKSAWWRTAAAATLLVVVGGAGWGASSRFSGSEPTGLAAKAIGVTPAATAVPVVMTPSSSEGLTPAPAFGQLEMRSEPPGATVLVDGLRRGTAPLVLDGLVPGSYTVEFANSVGSSRHTVQVEPGVTVSVVSRLPAPPDAPPTGWIVVSAPADVQVLQNGQLLGSSQGGRITLPVGTHQVDLVNDALGYRHTRTVQVRDGASTSISVEFPKGTLALNAVPWAEVWIDGQSVGETPIGNLSLSIGTHEVVFRHPELGEQRVTTTVTLTAPARVSVDLRKP
ncbi:MAG: PEGA domain-containing protein [Acidobacteriota bacterium]